MKKKKKRAGEEENLTPVWEAFEESSCSGFSSWTSAACRSTSWSSVSMDKSSSLSSSSWPRGPAVLSCSALATSRCSHTNKQQLCTCFEKLSLNSSQTITDSASRWSPTICLSVIVLVSVLNVLVQVWHLLGVALPVVLEALFASFDCAQALVDWLVVVAYRAFTICLARFPLQALERKKKNLIKRNKGTPNSSGEAENFATPESDSEFVCVKPLLLSALTGGPQTGWRQLLHCHAPVKP